MSTTGLKRISELQNEEVKSIGASFRDELTKRMSSISAGTDSFNVFMERTAAALDPLIIYLAGKRELTTNERLSAEVTAKHFYASGELIKQKDGLRTDVDAIISNTAKLTETRLKAELLMKQFDSLASSSLDNFNTKLENSLALNSAIEQSVEKVIPAVSVNKKEQIVPGL